MREKVTLTQKLQILPESPYSIRRITKTLGIARGSYYRESVLEVKDKRLAVDIERIHNEDDDTLGHKKLAPLLHTGKNRVLRVMKNMVLNPGNGKINITMQGEQIRYLKIWQTIRRYRHK